MLHALTLLPLVAPAAPAPTPSDALLSVVPADALVCVHAPNPKALIASRDTNAWMAFALDARWESVIDDLTPLMADDRAEAIAAQVKTMRRTLIEAAEDCTGAVVFVDVESAGAAPRVGLVAAAGPRFTQVLRRTVGENADEIQLAEGITALVDDSRRAELFLERGGYAMAFSAESTEAARAMAMSSLERLESPEPAGPLALPPVAARRRACALEVAVNLNPVWSQWLRAEGPFEGMEARVAQAVSSLEWMYGAATLGDGEDAGWEFVVPYGQETLIGDFLGFFGAADASLLRDVPASATTATVVSLDIGGMVDWILGMVEGNDQTAFLRIMGGIDAASGVIGFDILDDVVRNFTGDFVMFNEPTGLRFEDFTMPGDAPTFIARVEDSETMLDVVDTVMELSGMGSLTVSSDRALPSGDEVELWTATEEAPMGMGMGVGAGRLIFSMSGDGTGVGNYLDLVANAEGSRSFLSNDAVRAASESASGAAFTVQPTAAAATVIEQMSRMWAKMLDDLAEAFSDLEPEGNSAAGAEVPESRRILAAADRIAAMIRQAFNGTTTTELHVDGGTIRMIVRSE